MKTPHWIIYSKRKNCIYQGVFLSYQNAVLALDALKAGITPELRDELDWEILSK